MADIYFNVDTALSEVPVNVFPLTDDTDFKTRETAVAYNATGMDLVWNFVTSAGAFTQTAVTPTTAGDYDWTHQGDGMYTIEIPASGGASINNDTEGYGWFSGVATGVMPWRGPVCGFRAANQNAIDQGTALTGAVDHLGIVDAGTAQSATSTSLVLRSAASFANDEIIGATILITGGSAGVGQSRQITDYVSSTDTATVDAWTTTPTGTITYVVFATPPSSSSAPVDANVVQISGDATAADNLEAAYDGTGYDVGGIDVSELNAIVDDLLNGGRLDLLIDAIKDKTDSLTFTVSNQVDANIQSINDVTITGNGGSGTEFSV